MSKINATDIVEMFELKLLAKCMIIPTAFVIAYWIFV